MENKPTILHNQNTDLDLIELLIPYIQNKTFLDIGAEKGTFTTFFSSRGLTGVMFEPLPKFASELTEIAQQTNCVFLPYAVDSIDRSADFYVAYDCNQAPMDYFSSLHPLDHDTRINHQKIATVTCRSLNSLLEEGLIEKQIGILKIDTEGNDLNVLKGMNEVEAEILMCEYFMPGIYAGWELGHPLGLIEEAKKLGFENFIAIKRFNEFEFVSINNLAFVDRQWGNLIFLKTSIFTLVKNILNEYTAKKEMILCDEVMNSNNLLKKICVERLEVINTLDREYKILKNNYNKLQNSVITKLQAKFYNFVNAINKQS